MEATNRDLLKKFNEKTAELNESIKINNTLLARVNVYQSYRNKYNKLLTKNDAETIIFRLTRSKNWRVALSAITIPSMQVVEVWKK